MVTTDNEPYAQRLRTMRLHGMSQDAWNRHGAGGSWHYEVLEPGYKYNLTDLQSALGIVQLAKCDAMSEARRHIAETYTRAFDAIESLETPASRSDRETSWHLYVLRLDTNGLGIDRNRFIAELGEKGVQASVHFIPLHLQPAYQKLYGYKAGDLPAAETQYRRCLSLPIYPAMTGDEVQYVISSVREVVNHFARRAVCRSNVVAFHVKCVHV